LGICARVTLTRRGGYHCGPRRGQDQGADCGRHGGEFRFALFRHPRRAAGNEPGALRWWRLYGDV